MARMEDTHTPKAVLFGALNTGKRDQGAPKKRCKYQLKRELTLAVVQHHSWHQAASSRDNWRTTVRNASKAFECVTEVVLQRKDASSGRKGLLIKSLPFLPTSVQTVIESMLLALVLQSTLEPAKRYPSLDLRMRGTAIPAMMLNNNNIYRIMWKLPLCTFMVTPTRN